MLLFFSETELAPDSYTSLFNVTKLVCSSSQGQRQHLPGLLSVCACVLGLDDEESGGGRDTTAVCLDYCCCNQDHKQCNLASNKDPPTFREAAAAQTLAKYGRLPTAVACSRGVSVGWLSK